MSIASLYPSINPSLLLDFANSKVLDPRITFSRTTTATYYDGVTTAVAEQNLFTYSQEFDNAAWTKQNTTVTANSTAAPDGTTTADSLFETAVTGIHYIVQVYTTVAAQYTFSFYAKANGRTWAIANTYDGADRLTWFDLSGAGAVGTNAAGTTASITSVGNGWYRCSVTRSFSAYGVSFAIYTATADGVSSYLGDVTKGIYIWGAQLEQR